MPWADPRDIATVLGHIQGVAVNSAGWVRATCPLCLHGVKKNLFFSPESGWFNCFRCDTHGWAFGPPDKLSKLVKAAPPPGHIDLPEGFEPLEQDPLPLRLHPYAHYLLRRGIEVDTILDVGIGACCTGKHKGTVVVPVDVGNIQVGWVARAVVGKKYSVPEGFARQRVLFNQDALLDETDEPIAIVEGVMDALPHWPKAAACFGKPTEEHVEILMGARRPLVVMLDADARAEAWSLARRLWMHNLDARLGIVPAGHDPGEITREQFQTLMAQAKGVT